MKKITTFSLLISLLFAGISVFAQDTPAVTVANQFVSHSTVTIQSVVSDGDGWLVVHADNGEGAPGAVVGFAAVSNGVNEDVLVVLDTVNVTPTLFAMLHTDTGQAGVYEFGTVEGEDGPVMVDDNVVTPSFEVAMIQAGDQLVSDDNSITISLVTMSQAGWLVVHADNGDGTPGPVIGQSMVSAGTNTNVVAVLEGDVTDTLFPMLHEDTGEAGTYEFGSVEGADAPVRFDNGVAVTSFGTVPAIGINNQAVIGGDAMMGDTETVSLQAVGVLSDGPGWLVVHADNGEGAPGEVIGFAPVTDGFNSPIVVELSAEDVTPLLFPMLHEDTGEPNVYEFGEVEGADAPVTVDGNVVVTSVIAVPSITYSGALDGNVLTVDEVVIDTNGWLVIHADNNGAPGMVIGFTKLNPGRSTFVKVVLDEGNMTGTVFPMLHYDTDVIGEYEFGSVEGADGPVIVMDAVVTGSMMPEFME